MMAEIVEMSASFGINVTPSGGDCVNDVNSFINFFNIALSYITQTVSFKQKSETRKIKPFCVRIELNTPNGQRCWLF
jgi:hypothetical protein